MSTRKPDPRLVALSPFNLVLTTLWGECRGEPVEGQIAVANVIHNRLRSGRWGDTYHRVLLRWAQFSCLWETLDPRSFRAVMRFIKRIERIEDFDAAERQLHWIVQGLFSGAILDNTEGATHYFADYIDPPHWAKQPPARLTARYGRHLFYAGVR